MNIIYYMNCLFLILTQILSFFEINSSDREVRSQITLAASKSDNLVFTSGIRSIYQDSKGNYWFGSLQEGVAVYNGQSFKYFTANDRLTDNQIHSIQEDNKGVIWFNTQTGVSSYDGSSIKSHTNPVIQQTGSVFAMQRHEPLQGEWMKSDIDLWFEAGTKDGVYRFDGQKLTYLPLPPHKVLNRNDNLFAVTSISKGKKDMIWFGTYAGVFGYNGSKFTIINDETLGFDRNIAPLHIRSILEDSKGRLWIGNNGIGVLLREGDSVINFSEKNNLIHPASGRRGGKSLPGTLEHVFTIEEDSQGNIWFGDRDSGIWKFDGKNMLNYTKMNGLTNDFALSIFEDKIGKLWFGMADGSVYQFNGVTFEKYF